MKIEVAIKEYVREECISGVNRRIIKAAIEYVYNKTGYKLEVREMNQLIAYIIAERKAKGVTI